ncbi:MAG: hypothetical protein IJ061_07115, partial [Lachnospiraceae bacterium]|nr:hypothetical protein [Lachnospiraceae bacterium]
MQILLLELTIIMIILVLVLKRVLKKTLYSFTGIALTAGIIFCLASLFGISGAWVYFAHEPKGPSLVSYIQLLIQVSRFLTNTAFWGLLLMSALMAVSNIALIRHEGLRMKNVYGTLLGLAFIVATLVLYALTA